MTLLVPLGTAGAMIEVGKVCVCEGCGHRWVLRGVVPSRCARCKVRTWNRRGGAGDSQRAMQREVLKPKEGARVLPASLRHLRGEVSGKGRVLVRASTRASKPVVKGKAELGPGYCKHHILSFMCKRCGGSGI